MISTSVPCEVCHNQPYKYKCPICKFKYCSVSCYKKHKESCQEQKQQSSPASQSELSAECQQPSEQKQQQTSENIESISESYHLIQKTNGLLSQENLKKIENSPEINEVLKDERLQQLISRIVGSEKQPKPLQIQREMLDEALSTNREFEAFTERLLHTLRS